MEPSPESPKPEPPRIPLPEPAATANLPPQLRWPLEGRMEPPTVPPQTARERRAEIRTVQKRRSRRGFLLGLLVGQALIVGIIFGGDQLLRLRPDLQIGLPLRLLVLLGVTGGLVFTGAFIALLLSFQALGYVFRPRGKPFLAALGNGMRRVGRAFGAMLLTLLVLGGTAAATIPPEDWKPNAKFVRSRAREAVRRAPPWIHNLIRR